MKIISFALWGDNPKYNIGAIKNAELAKIHYPGWTCRFYIAENFDKHTIDLLSKYENVELLKVKQKGDWRFTIKRFLPAGEKDIDFFISRDCDSRISFRESLAVQRWINSDKASHIMRDHPFHGSFPMLAGMIGLKSNLISNIYELIYNFESQYNGAPYHFDQIFLANFIWPQIKNSCLIHDEIFLKNHFPSIRLNDEFVGESFDENDIPDKIGREAIKMFLNKK